MHSEQVPQQWIPRGPPEGEMEATLPLVTKDSVGYSPGIVHIQGTSRASFPTPEVRRLEEAGLEMATSQQSQKQKS